MSKKSDLEQLFLGLWAMDGRLPEPVSEYRFHPTRKWRFDFAWPDQMVAVEIEGGVYSHGRHTRPAGFMGDCEKYEAALLRQWVVFRVPGEWLDTRPVQVFDTINALVMSRS